ncbi:hypothetical protein HDV57DRAFT_11397 [Trichoderma longibrachiatum]
MARLMMASWLAVRMGRGPRMARDPRGGDASRMGRIFGRRAGDWYSAERGVVGSYRTRGMKNFVSCCYNVVALSVIKSCIRMFVGRRFVIRAFVGERLGRDVVSTRLSWYTTASVINRPFLPRIDLALSCPVRR